MPSRIQRGRHTVGKAVAAVGIQNAMRSRHRSRKGIPYVELTCEWLWAFKFKYPREEVKSLVTAFNIANYSFISA
jgi:hypothetical protein